MKHKHYSSSNEDVLTRLGFNSKMVVNGDQTQIDLPGKAKSGLLQAEHILANIEQAKLPSMMLFVTQ